MKRLHLIWVLGLAAGVAACASWTDQQVIQGCRNFNELTGFCEDEPPSGGGGTGGSGAVDQCLNTTDAATYDALEYVDSRGNSVTGSDAASAIASDCVFGSDSSSPQNPGCGSQAGAVLQCALVTGFCDAETIAALSVCVVDCQQTLIAEITGGLMLTQGCAACYGQSVSCSAENCAASNCTNPNSTECIRCRCLEGCTPGFDVCSGLPPTGACDPFL